MTTFQRLPEASKRLRLVDTQPPELPQLPSAQWQHAAHAADAAGLEDVAAYLRQLAEVTARVEQWRAGQGDG